eukprot:15195372-Alexandrium_andersonii.AAC.1
MRERCDGCHGSGSDAATGPGGPHRRPAWEHARRGGGALAAPQLTGAAREELRRVGGAELEPRARNPLLAPTGLSRPCPW